MKILPRTKNKDEWFHEFNSLIKFDFHPTRQNNLLLEKFYDKGLSARYAYTITKQIYEEINGYNLFDYSDQLWF